MNHRHQNQTKEQGNLLDHLKGNLFLYGLLSIVWFILRTGRKPSRASYPCQQAALLNGNIWIATYVLPLTTALRPRTLRFTENKRSLLIVMTIIIVSTTAFWITSMKTGVTPIDMTIAEDGLELTSKAAVIAPASDIFAITGTNGDDDGLKKLVELMGSQGLKFYNSPNIGPISGPTGLIKSDDVVLLKVNCQWDERGGTNTDLVKALIQAIIDHPDGFTGEVIVADNGQGENRGSLGRGGSFTYPLNNAVDQSQSIQKVVDSFADTLQVSTYLWTDITETLVEEYSYGDIQDGYVVNVTENPRTGIMVSYPKFQTEYDTYVSFKHGIWDPETQTYDSDKLKVINVPVLKSHSVYGVTASVKHYMGVPSDVLTSRISGRNLATHKTIGNGGMGTLMVETRYPVLNILDAIWINAVPGSGPKTPYEASTNTQIIMAGTDPVALDYWSSKYVLLQTWQISTNTTSDSMDPDNTAKSYFGNWLRLSMNEIQRAGYQTTVDENQMNVYVTQLS